MTTRNRTRRGFAGMSDRRQREISSMGGRARGGYRNRTSSNSYNEGRGHGGWFGDSEGHSEAAERGWENRGVGGRRSRNYDYNDGGRGHGHGGWFGDSEGHSEAARRGWGSQDRNYGGRRDNYDYDEYEGRGRGWFDNSQEHSEAAERGWENRGGGRRYEDDDYDNNYDDYEYENEGRGHGHGGWFGDAEGHAEAAERGWRNRR